MTITIVTPWYFHEELWRDYLEAVSVATPDDDVYIVDNNGGMSRHIQASIRDVPNPPFRIMFSASDENLGFTRSCNEGLEAATGDAVLFINNDIRMISPDWLERFRDAMEPGVLVGAQLRLDAHANVDGEKFPYLDGWCIGGMTVDLRDLGGFDETLEEPAYYSDNLLCLEARAQGMTLREVKVGLRHKLNVTAEGHPNRSAATIANYERYVARARELLAVKA